jgi:hypothetical protein
MLFDVVEFVTLFRVIDHRFTLHPAAVADVHATNGKFCSLNVTLYTLPLVKFIETCLPCPFTVTVPPCGLAV